MTTTTTPPPDDIPGVTRRHRLSDLYHERTNFQFIKHSRRWAILSGVMLLISISALAVRHLNLSIDFEGGTAWQVQMADGRDASVSEVRDLLAPIGFGDAKVRVLSGQSGESVRVQAEVLKDPIRTIQETIANAGKVEQADVLFQRSEAGGGTFTFTPSSTAEISEDDVAKALAAIDQPDADVAIADGVVTVTFSELPASPLQQVIDTLAEYAGTDAADVTIDTVGPTWGETVTRNAIRAMLLFFVLLALYLTFRFEWKMSASSIIAVLHDIIITVGVYALLQFEVSPATVTAFLTILGFSLYDTVVVFDKIRENQRALTATGRSTYSEMVNRSLNAVLMRSLSTTLVALLPVVSLLVVGSWIMGAESLEEFALALATGLFIGAYSSIFVAAPLLAAWKEREPQYRALAERRRRAGTGPADRPARGAYAPNDVDADAVLTNASVSEGVPGPPAVGRTTIAPRARQQRRRKR